MNLFEMKQKREAALSKAESFVLAAENASRPMNETEVKGYDAAMIEVNAISADIQRVEAVNTLRTQFPKGQIGTVANNAGLPAKSGKKTFSADYDAAFWGEYMSNRGEKVSAALYEGSNAAGGYAVPVTVDGTIVPLAPQEMAIRQLARVIPTTNDIKFPQKLAHGTAAAKAEGVGDGAQVFAGTSPTLSQITLSAFMAGDVVPASWELLQDVDAARAFLNDDIILAVQQYEEPKFITGTGSGEPQGVAKGCDVGVTVTGAHLVQGAITLDSMDDLIGSLNPVYLSNASLLTLRATFVLLRKLQRQANLFDPRISREGQQWYFDGFPVSFSASMQSGATDQDRPVLFGDFKRGYVIGDRGGSGISVKVLDQTRAKEGMTEFLAYRRTDGRVIRSEAIKALKLATGA